MKPQIAMGAKPDAGKVSFPVGLHNAFLFAGFNALSYQIVLMSPMVLYAKTLGASATVLGIITGMMPLLVIFQIPAAHYLHRVGYKKFVLGGWGTRVMFIFLIAAVPLLRFLDNATRLALILMFLFAFNLSRGISSCAWLPWIASLVPEQIRGRYLTRDAAWVNCGSFVTIVFSAFLLGENPAQWRFSILFAFSALTGAASLVFLNRIPEVESPEETRSSRTGVPWREIVAYKPFQKLLRMIMAWAVALGGLVTFTVAFMKAETGLSDGKILLMTSMQFLGGLSSLWLLGSRLDRLGSRPILIFSAVMYLLILAGWFGVAGHLLTPGLALILTLQFLMGLGAALVSMANTKLAMTIIPVMGRNHFFALYSVVGNLTLGLSPIFWGLLIDFFKTYRSTHFGIEWTRYTVFFATASMAFLVAMLFSQRVEEPKAASFDALLRELLIQSPQRVWLRFWPRS
jgi:MFS family permease